jgi:hypothetical protein
MGRDSERRRDSLALRSAYARRRAWQARLEEAESVDDANGMREAVKFIAEYDALIAELEKQAGAG